MASLLKTNRTRIYVYLIYVLLSQHAMPFYDSSQLGGVHTHIVVTMIL